MLYGSLELLRCTVSPALNRPSVLVTVLCPRLQRPFAAVVAEAGVARTARRSIAQKQFKSDHFSV